MTATTEANWAPLEARLRCDVKVIREFMWMFGDANTGVEYYKHSITRRYLLLHRDGRCFQQSLNGLVEVDFATDLVRVREHPEEGR
ncbi:MAG: hypothetical protein SGI92_12295 [Bryobacteraceae bacterium]|nr:hypothetical protein [Bryobacteraceae bacterium]